MRCCLALFNAICMLIGCRDRIGYTVEIVWCSLCFPEGKITYLWALEGHNKVYVGLIISLYVV
jgi:hypothetical protein